MWVGVGSLKIIHTIPHVVTYVRMYSFFHSTYAYITRICSIIILCSTYICKYVCTTCTHSLALLLTQYIQVQYIDTCNECYILIAKPRGIVSCYPGTAGVTGALSIQLGLQGYQVIPRNVGSPE